MALLAKLRFYPASPAPPDTYVPSATDDEEPPPPPAAEAHHVPEAGSDMPVTRRRMMFAAGARITTEDSPAGAAPSGPETTESAFRRRSSTTQRAGTTPRTSAHDNVIDNLHLVLGTREDYGSFVRGFGLPVYAELGTGGAADLGQRIAACIARFEPRFEDAIVTFLRFDGGWLHYRLAGSVEGVPLQLHFHYQAQLGATRLFVERSEDC
jgi:hypothetical protein